jgi:FHS family L-fucose permease-like MFS transporter
MQQLTAALTLKKQVSILGTFGICFFIWGVISGLNLFLINHLKNIFHLNYSVSSLIQFTFFSTYLIVSLPAGRLIKNWGYKLGLIIGLFTTGLGCMLFYFAIYLKNYYFFLGALAIQATGITLLQVGANLYILFFGDRSSAVARLTFMQGLNALGTFLAPIYGSKFVADIFDLTFNSSTNDALMKEAVYVQSPYILLSIVMYFLTIFFVFVDIPEFVTKDIEPLNRESGAIRRTHVMHFKQLRLGAFAVFAYLGAEFALSYFLVTYDIENTKYYWGAALLGRLLGTLLLLKWTPRKILTIASITATSLIVASIFTPTAISIWPVVTIGLFNSVMFPCIYVLGINGLGKYSEEGSSIMIMAFVGGGIISFNTVNFAHAFGYKVAFILPLICYLYIYFYAKKGSKFRTKSNITSSEAFYTT